MASERLTSLTKLLTLLWIVLSCNVAHTGDKKAASSERYQAILVGQGHLSSGLRGRLDIVIERWTSDEEREGLLKTLMGKNGQREFVKALFNAERTGYVKLPDTVAYDLKWARSTKTENGRHIVLATERAVSFNEQTRGGRSRDYNVSLIELHVDEAGNGDGRMALAVKLSVDPKTSTLNLETLDVQPIRLNAVKRK